MKKTFLAFAVAGLLSGCAAITAALPVVTAAIPAASDASGKVILEGTRALVLANNTYQGASAALVPLVNNGKLSREQLLRMREINNRAFVLLTTGNDGLTQAQRAAQVMNLADELNRMAGK